MAKSVEQENWNAQKYSNAVFNHQVRIGGKRNWTCRKKSPRVPEYFHLGCWSYLVIPLLRNGVGIEGLWHGTDSTTAASTLTGLHFPLPILPEESGRRASIYPTSLWGCSTRPVFMLGQFWACRLRQKFSVDPTYMRSGLSTTPDEAMPKGRALSEFFLPGGRELTRRSLLEGEPEIYLIPIPLSQVVTQGQVLTWGPMGFHSGCWSKLVIAGHTTSMEQMLHNGGGEMPEWREGFWYRTDTTTTTVSTLMGKPPFSSSDKIQMENLTQAEKMSILI